MITSCFFVSYKHKRNERDVQKRILLKHSASYIKVRLRIKQGKPEGKKMEVLCSPVNGKATMLENVHDEMFSEKMLGDGIAVIPDENELRSPVEGTVTMIYETQHAIGIQTDLGTDILIHIGIDTVQLHGVPFQTKAKVGDRVKQGDLLTIVDWDMIRNKNMDVIVPIIVTNKRVDQMKTNGDIRVGEPLFEIV